VSTGASACRAALEALGTRRIAAFSPYQPVADRQVKRFFEEAGFEVVRVTGLRCKSATAIADVGEEELRGVLRDLDGPDVEAIVQAGTNLSMVASGRRGRALAGQARHRHQRGHLLARPPRLRHLRSLRRLRLPPPRALR
jgi:maleate isomerase